MPAPSPPPDDLPPVAARFWRYVQIDTQSDSDSRTVPSTAKQKELGHRLVQELQGAGCTDAEIDEHGYVYATLPARGKGSGAPGLALLAHQDTSPDAPGAGVRPQLHRAYNGGRLPLPGAPDVALDPERQPALARHSGEDVISSDGTTLLGSDDKAGVAILMQLAADWPGPNDPADGPLPRVRLCFTVDEEIGRGTDHLSLERLGADAAYTLDGSGVDTIYAETFNAAEVTVTVEGAAVHPGYAKGVMVNAARILSRLVAALPPEEAPETTAGREGYFHPHTLREGTPARAEAKILLRDFAEQGLQRRKDFLRALVETLCHQHPEAEISLEIEEQYKNMRPYIEETDPRAVSFAHDAAGAMGMTLSEKLVRGGTDGARLSECGLPTPNLFTGGYDFHSRFEWNTVQNLERALAFTQALLHRWGRAT